MDAKKIHVGASGWIYDDWAQRFYPKGVKGTDRLLYYCTQFDTVEVNSTFYRTPSEKVIASWNKRLPRGYHFVVKGSRIVTHLKRLKNCEDSLAMFLERALRLKRLKVILWQLPPGLHKDLKRLDHFLGELPKTVRHAVEFRHESWWDAEVRETLARHKAAFVAVSHPELPETVFPTTDFLYLRFHGKGVQRYRYDYSPGELAEWAARVQPFLRGRTLYAFFNNDYHAWAPKNAALFRDLILNTLR